MPIRLTPEEGLKEFGPLGTTISFRSRPVESPAGPAGIRPQSRQEQLAQIREVLKLKRRQLNDEDTNALEIVEQCGVRIIRSTVNGVTQYIEQGPGRWRAPVFASWVEEALWDSPRLTREKLERMASNFGI